MTDVVSREEICKQHAEEIKNLREKFHDIKNGLNTIGSHWIELKMSLEAMDKRINGTIGEHAKHVEQGEKWRMAVVGIVFAGIVQVVAFAYLFGNVQNTVSRNNTTILAIAFNATLALAKSVTLA